jgi:AraC-like DNA-binding protein
MPSHQRPAFISAQVVRGEYLFLDLDPPRHIELAVACAGREDCAADYRIDRKGFRYHAVEYIVSGAWEFKTRKVTQKLGPGALFAYGPGTEYSLRALSKSGLVKYFVDFTGRNAAKLLKASGLPAARPAQIRHARWLRDILDQLIDCANLPPSAARRIAPLLTTLFLARIREDIRSKPLPTHSRESYERCRQFIADHYRELRGVGEAARGCAVSSAYLSRLFQRNAGESPLRYLTRLKMHHAAELIHRQNYPVKAAGAAVGFEDPYHFSRVFKRIHGVSPSRFASQSGLPQDGAEPSTHSRVGKALRSGETPPQRIQPPAVRRGRSRAPRPDADADQMRPLNRPDRQTPR